ncbi:hypothetical protein E2C01_094149 [Portunus trituberculatus]|uniref:Uncharacterized protein n=1 Tax=Portunus trituberculatus TaxID=210409 RepID=A0A5B7K0U3_PORTR|nr:hypothetical protein [Portunus trituberculatus]
MREVVDVGVKWGGMFGEWVAMVVVVVDEVVMRGALLRDSQTSWEAPGCRYSQITLELQEVSPNPPPQFEFLCSMKPASILCLAVLSSLVAPLVKDVVVMEVVLVCLRGLTEGLRWCALLINCVIGTVWGLGFGFNGRLSIDFSPSVRPFKAIILRCGPQDITFLNAFLCGGRTKRI